MIEIGAVLIKGLSLSSLIPVPVGILIVVSLISAIIGYFTICKTNSKKNMVKALDIYLKDTKKQFILWFDEIEKYFYDRVEEIKLSL